MSQQRLTGAPLAEHNRSVHYYAKGYAANSGSALNQSFVDQIRCSRAMSQSMPHHGYRQSDPGAGHNSSRSRGSRSRVLVDPLVPPQAKSRYFLTLALLSLNTIASRPQRSHQTQPAPRKKRFTPIDELTARATWYLGSASNDDAEYRLRGRSDGAFVLRDSSSLPGCFVLSYRCVDMDMDATAALCCCNLTKWGIDLVCLGFGIRLVM